MTNAPPTLGMWNNLPGSRQPALEISDQKVHKNISRSQGAGGALMAKLKVLATLHLAQIRRRSLTMSRLTPRQSSRTAGTRRSTTTTIAPGVVRTTTSSGALCTRFRGAVLPSYIINLLQNCQLSLARKRAYRMGATPPTAYEWPAPPSCGTMRPSSAAPP